MSEKKLGKAKEDSPSKPDKDHAKSSASNEDSLEDKKPIDTDKTFIWLMIIIVSVIALLLLFPTFVPKESDQTLDDRMLDAVSGHETDTQFEYNGYGFVYQEGLWYTQIQNKDKAFVLPMHYSPRELEDVPFEGYLDSFLTYMMVTPIEGVSPSAYITFDPTLMDQKYIAVANGELSFSIAKTLGVLVRPACTVNETAACATLPIIDCNETNVPTIYLDLTGEAGVEVSRSCVHLKGTELELMRSVDRFLYSVYGVMSAT